MALRKKAIGAAIVLIVAASIALILIGNSSNIDRKSGISTAPDMMAGNRTAKTNITTGEASIAGTWVNDSDDDASIYVRMADNGTYYTWISYQDDRRAIMMGLTDGKWSDEGGNMYNLSCTDGGYYDPSSGLFHLYVDPGAEFDMRKENDSQVRAYQGRVEAGMKYAVSTHAAPIIFNASMLSDVSPGGAYPCELYKTPAAHNTTYQKVIDFIRGDKTNRIPYDPDPAHRFVCLDYALGVQKNAENAGIAAGIVTLLFSDGTGHAINVFNTTDRGPIYIDCTGIEQIAATPTIGTNYTTTRISDNSTMGSDGIIIEEFEWWP